MDHFRYQQEQLHAESVKIADIAAEVGSPFYCYSTATLQRHYSVFSQGLAAVDHQICYAVKANSNLAVLRVLAKMGSGADVVSEGEIRRALAAGITPDKLVFSGVGKTRDEMAYALDQGVFQFNVESENELLALDEVARSKQMKAPMALRINPDVDAKSHAKISTGKKENKFGVPMERAVDVYAKAAALDGIAVQGVSMHIGSQLTDLAPFRAAYGHARDFVQQLRGDGHAISVLDIGGGLGVPYEADGATPPAPSEYGQMVAEVLGDIGCKLVFEPGRLIVGNAGILVSQVIYVKQTDSRTFLILDAAMNDLLRPSLYDAHHDIIPVTQPQVNAKRQAVDIVGPVCETGDSFAKGRLLPMMNEGDLVAFRTAGAYGAVMANSYNSRLLVPEVLVDGDRFAVIRPRPTYDALLALDVVPEWMG